MCEWRADHSIVSEQYSSKGLEWAKVIAVPLSLGLLAGIFGLLGAREQAERDAETLNSQYVNLAINMLSSPIVADGETGGQAMSDSVLRGWAIDLLSKTSPVDVSSELRAAFESGSVVLPAPQLAPDLVGTIEIASLDATFVRYRFRSDTTTTYSAEVELDGRVVHNSSGTATANQLVGITADGLDPGTDYTIKVTLDGSPSKTAEATARTTGGEASESRVPVQLLDLRVTERQSTQVQLNYESNICANGSFVLFNAAGNEVGSNAGQTEGCGTNHLAVPGMWTPALQPDSTYRIEVTVEANGRGQGNGNVAIGSFEFTTAAA